MTKPFFLLDGGIGEIASLVIKVRKRILEIDVNIAVRDGVSDLQGNTGKHGGLKVRAILADPVVVIVVSRMGKKIRDGLHHGKAVGHIVIFLNQIFQGQNNLLGGGLCGAQKLSFQDARGIGVQKDGHKENGQHGKRKMGKQQLILHLHVVQIIQL